MICSPRILLVEDNPADARLTIEAFQRTGTAAEVEVCEDGESALARLRDPAAPLPQLVLLDLNLPGIDGREVLEILKADPALRQVPVCILTTSRAEEDISRAYAHHTNCYVVKPVELDALRTAVHQIEQFWLRTAQLPPRRRTPGPA